MDKGSDQCGDVLLVAHGHILRAFAMRWAGYALREGPTFLLEAGGVGTLRYVVIVFLLYGASIDNIQATSITESKSRLFYLAAHSLLNSTAKMLSHNYLPKRSQSNIQMHSGISDHRLD
jgi:hypothetical protein